MREWKEFVCWALEPFKRSAIWSPLVIRSLQLALRPLSLPARHCQMSHTPSDRHIYTRPCRTKKTHSIPLRK